MLISTILILLIATILGLVITAYIYKDKETPKAYVLLHGLLSIIGIAVLGIYTYQHFSYLIVIAILVITSIGGMIVTYKDFLGLNRSKILIITHIILGAIAIILLVYFYLFEG